MKYIIAIIVLMASLIAISGCTYIIGKANPTNLNYTNSQPQQKIVVAKLVNVTGGDFDQWTGYYEGTLHLVDVKSGENYSIPACSKNWDWVKNGSCYEFDLNEINQNIEQHKYSAELSGCYIGELKEVKCH